MSINTHHLIYPSDTTYSKYQFNCKNCDYVCSSKSIGSRNMKIKLHRKVCGNIKEDLVARMKRMAYNKLCEDSPNKAELLLKDDAHVDAVLKLFNIKIDTKNL